MTGAGERRGAYGLALAGVDGARDLLVPAPPGWLPWRLRREVGEGSGDGSVADDRASLAIIPAGGVVVDRAESTSVFTMPDPPRDHELVHPYLGPTAAVVARWLRRDAFHAGGVMANGGAWGVLGDRGAGKSSLLAHLSSCGAGIVADDLLVVDGGTAYAGPRCLDLRGDVAETLGVGESIGVVGTRERWRVRTRPVEAEAPLAGWIVLEWGERVEIRRVPPAERLPRLVENLAVIMEPLDSPALVDLAALPMLAFARPRDFAALDTASDALLRALDD